MKNIHSLNPIKEEQSQAQEEICMQYLLQAKKPMGQEVTLHLENIQKNKNKLKVISLEQLIQENPKRHMFQK